jgi:hypothetical protein
MTVSTVTKNNSQTRTILNGITNVRKGMNTNILPKETNRRGPKR